MIHKLISVLVLVMKKNIYAVHCWIKGGGALNVLEAFIHKKIRNWQSVDAIFTLYSDRNYLEITDYGLRITDSIWDGDNGEWWKEWIRNSQSLIKNSTYKIPIITALPYRLNNLFRRVDKKKPSVITYFLDYRNLMPFFPILMERLSKKLARALKQQDADVLISSYAVAKNIDIPEWIFKEIYFHQPMHYIRPLYEEYVGYMKWWKRWLYKKITPKLRRRDSKPRQYNVMYANSESTKQQIQDIYFPWKQVDIQVVHPPIDEAFFHESVVTVPDNYFFYINRLTKMFKHLDKIIHVCNEYKVPLIIAGDGPDKIELMKIAGPTITFVGRVSDKATKISLMKKSKGVLNIAHESFGIVTAEALLLGVPVFWYHGWATPELVDEESGLLWDSLDEKVLSDQFSKFISTDYDRQIIQDNARERLSEGQKFWC